MKTNIGKLLSLVLTISILLAVVFYNNDNDNIILNDGSQTIESTGISHDIAFYDVKEHYTPFPKFSACEDPASF